MSLDLKEFLNGPVREFSIYNNQRSLPSGIDGLKPSQRKVLFGMLKKYPSSEVKVSIASAGIMEVSEYHHGSLDGVITGMAQGFVGTNNYPLLEGIGQFGSRIENSPSAPRYIKVKLSKWVKKLFRDSDNLVLEEQEDEGTKIEPKYYLPILPTVLLNGSVGIATGWACEIPPHKLEDVRDYIVKRLRAVKVTQRINPWYAGYNGKIIRDGDQVYSEGIIEKVDTTTVRITELPVGVYTMDYRSVLVKLEERGQIVDFDDVSNDDHIEFVVKMQRKVLNGKSQEQLINLFKLRKTINYNITVWDENESLRTFVTPEELIDWYIGVRLKKYEQRKLALVGVMTNLLDELNERIRFIELYIRSAKEWSILNKKDIMAILHEEQFKDEHIQKFMNIAIYKLTGEEIKNLRDQIWEVECDRDTLAEKTSWDIWLEELQE